MLKHVHTIGHWYWTDRERTEDTTQMHLPVGLDPEEAIDAVNGFFAAQIGALTDCALIETNIAFHYFDAAEEAGTLPTSDEAAARGALFFLCDPEPNDQFVLDIPALKPECYLADGVEIDLTHPDVAALIEELTADGAADCINAWGARLIECESGLQRSIPLNYGEPSG